MYLFPLVVIQEIEPYTCKGVLKPFRKHSKAAVRVWLHKQKKPPQRNYHFIVIRMEEVFTSQYRKNLQGIPSNEKKLRCRMGITCYYWHLKRAIEPWLV